MLCGGQAEVCGYDDYRAVTTKPSTGEVKAAGKYRQEGKTYIVQDSDIIHCPGPPSAMDALRTIIPQ